MSIRFLTALPVFNEVNHVEAVLAQVAQYAGDLLVVDDGSSDGTPELLEQIDLPQLSVVHHSVNQGYGAALRTAFDYAIEHGYDWVITIDCDGQHEPQRIPEFMKMAAEKEVDILSGSRYLKQFPGDSVPPPERRRINQMITSELNRRLGLNLTDAFCGFKAYHVPLLTKLTFSENNYGMPLEVWVEAVRLGAMIEEVAVPLIYLDEKRSFGGALDDGSTRLQYYHLVLDRSLAKVQGDCFSLDLATGMTMAPCEDT
ncbi:Glycosyltransferase involved in cell wall bisynthesis [Planctomycetales bacterium 10988]|nr:Glycosyltransferase involved in cell wall bisynthesis [Planctomycetales bacterium 10988]